MSIPRLILVLLSTLGVMLCLVVLRTERARLQHAHSMLEIESEGLQQDIRERQLELARIGNPTQLRQRLIDLNAPETQPAPKEKPAVAKPRKP